MYLARTHRVAGGFPAARGLPCRMQPVVPHCLILALLQKPRTRCSSGGRRCMSSRLEQPLCGLRTSKVPNPPCPPPTHSHTKDKHTPRIRYLHLRHPPVPPRQHPLHRLAPPLKLPPQLCRCILGGRRALRRRRRLVLQLRNPGAGSGAAGSKLGLELSVCLRATSQGMGGTQDRWALVLGAARHRGGGERVRAWER